MASVVVVAVLGLVEVSVYVVEHAEVAVHFAGASRMWADGMDAVEGDGIEGVLYRPHKNILSTAECRMA